MAAPPEAKYTEETLLWVKHHTPKLITFAITRPEAYRFAAGQFSRLGFHDGQGFIWRAYSVVSAEYADKALSTLRAHRLGEMANIIGTVVADEHCFVQMQTRLGGRRVVDWLTGEPLPRIC